MTSASSAAATASCSWPTRPRPEPRAAEAAGDHTAAQALRAAGDHTRRARTLDEQLRLEQTRRKAALAITLRQHETAAAAREVAR